MKIIHTSFAAVKGHSDPAFWLQQIPFFTGIVQEMGRSNTVISIHHMDTAATIIVDGATYQFFKASVFQSIIPYNVCQLLKNEKPDVVILHGLHSSWRNFLIAFLLRRHASIFIQHHAEKPLTGIRGLIQSLCDRFIAGYFFCSNDLSRSWIARGLIKDDEKIHEVMEGSSAFEQRVRSEALLRTGVVGAPVFIWVGRLDANKDPETLIAAFKKYLETEKGARLFMISKGRPLTSWIRNLLSNETSITFVGEVPHDEMEWWYSSADFVVSTSHYEGSGLSVCEAMACGCIPVLSDIPSFRMMTSNGEVGLLFAPGDAKALVHALMACGEINVEEARRAVARKFKEKLSFQAIAGAMIEVIENNRRAG